MKYYIVENGNPSGPFEVEELIANGLRGGDLVWTEGFPDWVVASEVAEIAMALASATACEQEFSAPEAPKEQCAPEMPPYQGQQQNPYQQPTSGQPPRPQGQYWNNGQPQYQQPPYQQPQNCQPNGFQPLPNAGQQPPYCQQPQFNQPPYGQQGWQQQQPVDVPPKSWLAESIILTLCCCIPIGIYCIVKSSQVNSLWYQGQYEEARKASDTSKKWLIIGLIIGIVFGILQFIWGMFNAIGVSEELNNI